MKASSIAAVAAILLLVAAGCTSPSDSIDVAWAGAQPVSFDATYVHEFGGLERHESLQGPISIVDWQGKTRHAYELRSASIYADGDQTSWGIKYLDHDLRIVAIVKEAPEGGLPGPEYSFKFLPGGFASGLGMWRHVEDQQIVMHLVEKERIIDVDVRMDEEHLVLDVKQKPSRSLMEAGEYRYVDGEDAPLTMPKYPERTRYEEGPPLPSIAPWPIFEPGPQLPNAVPGPEADIDPLKMGMTWAEMMEDLMQDDPNLAQAIEDGACIEELSLRRNHSEDEYDLLGNQVRSYTRWEGDLVLDTVGFSIRVENENGEAWATVTGSPTAFWANGCVDGGVSLKSMEPLFTVFDDETPLGFRMHKEQYQNEHTYMQLKLEYLYLDVTNGWIVEYRQSQDEEMAWLR